MLRHLKVKNFVYFKEEYSLDFRRGSNFFIGRNISGKSSIFEAIRRCTSTSKNVSFSRPFDPREPSVVVAFFRDSPEQGQLVSSILRLPDPKTDHEVQVYVKIVYVTHSKTLELDFVKENSSGGIVNQHINLSESQKKSIYENASEFNEKTFDIKKFVDTVLEEITKLRKDFENADIDENTLDTECEKILKDKIDPHVTVMFHKRSIGTLQWSKSKRVSNEYKDKNADDVQQRAEILKWYFDNVKLQNSVEDKLQSEYFDIITNSCDIEFIREDNEIKVRNRTAGKWKYAADSTEAVTLVKISDGIIEAKNCAIMLAMKSAKTICIEEPEKGMNPQMIERLRDLVLQQIHDKTIILTSHHPAILSPWTVPRIWFFRRIHHGDELTFKIIPGTVIENLDCGNDEKKTPRIVTSDHFASMFFASRVLLLEGEADFLFLTTVKEILLKDPDRTRQMLDVAVQIDKPNVQRFGTYLCSLHIVKMNGEQNKLRLYRLCQELHIESILLLDYDAIMGEKKMSAEEKATQSASKQKEEYRQSADAEQSISQERRKAQNVEEKATEAPLKAVEEKATEAPLKAKDKSKQLPKTADRFLEDFSLSKSYTAQQVQLDVTVLEENAIFVWNNNGSKHKVGTVEEVVMILCEHDEERVKFLTDRNVNLDYKRQPKTKSHQKLFGDKKVTSANITEVVNKLLVYAEKDHITSGKESQLLRLLKFLYGRATQHKITEPATVT